MAQKITIVYTQFCDEVTGEESVSKKAYLSRSKCLQRLRAFATAFSGGDWETYEEQGATVYRNSRLHVRYIVWWETVDVAS